MSASGEGLQAALDAMVPIADQLRQGATYCEQSFEASSNKVKVVEKTKTYTSQCLENFAGHVLNAMKEVDDLLKARTAQVRTLDKDVRGLETRMNCSRLLSKAKMMETVSFEEDTVTDKVEILSTLEGNRSVARENFDFDQLSGIGISASEIFRSATEEQTAYHAGNGGPKQSVVTTSTSEPSSAAKKASATTTPRPPRPTDTDLSPLLLPCRARGSRSRPRRRRRHRGSPRPCLDHHHQHQSQQQPLPRHPQRERRPQGPHLPPHLARHHRRRQSGKRQTSGEAGPWPTSWRRERRKS